MAPLTREQFLGRTKRRTRAVTFDDGTEIQVRQPSALEWDEFDFELPHFRARLVCRFAVDEKGGRLFQDTDVNKLVQVGADQIELAAEAVMDLAGATRRAVERLAKNWRRTASDNSSTASPPTSASPAA